jgi:signal transduction histidine kinase
MKLKTQFIINIITFSIILIIIGASVAITQQQITDFNMQESYAHDIQVGASDLNYISSNYFLYQSDSSIGLWQTKVSSLSNELSTLNSTNPQQQEQVGIVSNDLENLNIVFAGVTSFLANAPRNTSVRVLPSFQTQWNRMAVQIQALAFDSQQLSQTMRDKTNQAIILNAFLTVALLAVFGAFFLTTYLLNYRKTLRSISELKNGIGVIGSGNLDYTVEAGKKDEIADISYSINQMAANLKSVTKQLKDSEKLATIGATAGMVGHDIRNPLQAIIGDLFLAKTDLASIPESEEKQAILESLRSIENNIDYINKIVQDLQDYARPLNPKPEDADLKLIITKLFVKNNLPDNIELSVKVEDSAEKISADPYYINRIMFNLINNAVQAMPNGGTLTVHAFRSPKDIVMTVKDTGVGIPKEIQGKMFTPMFTTKSKGQGFGLPVVKRMTESLGGTVTFESQEGKGTIFTVRLPLNT